MKSTNIILIIIAIVAISAIIIFIRNRPITQSNQDRNITTEKKAGKEKDGIFTSIREAMSKSLSLKCEYNTGTSKTVAYIKGTLIRVDGSWKGKSDSVTIIKDNKLWNWDTVKKTGIIMPLQANKDKKQTLDSEEIINNLEKEKQYCHTAIVSNSVFNPPTDVKFQDLSQLFEKISGLPQQTGSKTNP